jgi:hypothetical protein
MTGIEIEIEDRNQDRDQGYVIESGLRSTSRIGIAIED